MISEGNESMVHTRGEALGLRTRHRPRGSGGATRPVAGPSRRRTPAWWRRQATPWLYLLVPLALLVAFTYIPVGDMLQWSFTDWDGISPTYKGVGLRNYQTIFSDPDYYHTFFVSLYYLAASVVQLALALYFATILSFNTRFRNVFKGILFFPYLLNGVAVGYVFLYVFQPHGILDSTLKVFGYHNTHLWLGSSTWVNPSLAGVSVWRFMGLNMVLFLGAIQSINPELYEATEIDGANRWHQFRYIIAPSIRPLLSLSMILAISGSLAVFEIPFIMTGGAGASRTFVIQSQAEAFHYNKLGLASAFGITLLLIVLLITWVQRLLLPDEKVDLI